MIVVSFTLYCANLDPYIHTTECLINLCLYEAKYSLVHAFIFKNTVLLILKLNIDLYEVKILKLITLVVVHGPVLFLTVDYFVP